MLLNSEEEFLGFLVRVVALRSNDKRQKRERFVGSPMRDFNGVAVKDAVQSALTNARWMPTQMAIHPIDG